MGGVDVDTGGKKRSTNSEINMVPFIDLLFVTVAFLLITAVWVTNSRINADAQVPGPPDPNKELTHPLACHAQVLAHFLQGPWGAPRSSAQRSPPRRPAQQAE